MIYVSPKHWACFLNKFSVAENAVDLFDSMHTIPTEDGSIICQACVILQTKFDSIRVNVVDAQLQEGGDDCSLFATAMATDLCNGIDPFGVQYKQGMLINHLRESFETEHMTTFPSTVHAGSSVPGVKRALYASEVQVYCKCRQPEYYPMAACDVCDVWYHSMCVPIPPAVLDDTNDSIP